jgi:alginate O-acetyltransferase complex protein AlgI
LTLFPILVSILVALLIGWVAPPRWRTWIILVASLLGVYWLQAVLPIRNLGFWLPTVSVSLTIIVWFITQKFPSQEGDRRKLFAWGGGLVIGIILALALTRYLGSLCCLTATRPPGILGVMLFMLIGGGIALAPIFFPATRRALSMLAILLIIGLFIILKTPALLTFASQGLRNLTGQAIDLANPQDIIWFGFSFLAFRLLHVLFDFRSGKLPSYDFHEFVVYVLFFPALPAGPIDRSQRFIDNLHQSQDLVRQNRLQAAQRIMWGLFKKFFIADSLALIALNSQNAAQVNSTVWMWLVLYAYSLRIYFDFSGYTDLAIGTGKLMGINLPENFDNPYFKQNLTSFWNSWHITLAQWFRAYYFNPVTRALRTRAKSIPAWVIILFGQFTTMLLIGLWHGITWNFAIWGAWHGLGLFFHNRWLEMVRRHPTSLDERPHVRRIFRFFSWFLTFNYVSLGWIWFALPSIKLSLDVFQKLV